MTGTIVGTNLAHYRILEQIGAGGMGEVYRAEDSKLRREVAIKILPQTLAQDVLRLRRFEQEARAAASLNHPNILAIYEIGTHEGSPYLVSELLEGETLRKRLANGPMPLRKASDFAIQVLQGLAAAHEKGIVHRDIKPDNLFITKDGRAKILDFGVAKLTRAAEELSDGATLTGSSTEAGTVLGSAGYMSPEQIRAQDVDHRSDIFSFGAVFYEMLTAQKAFRGDTGHDRISATLMSESPDPASVVPGLPPVVSRIVHHCLEKKAEERYQSARDLAFELGTLADYSTVTRTFKTGPLPAERRRLLWYAAAALAVVLVGIAVFVAGRRSASVTAPHYQRVTFQHGTVFSARFAPDQQSVAYSASWNGEPGRVLITSGDTPDARRLELDSAHLLAVSSSGELALAVRGVQGPHFEFQRGTLARAPMVGGAPREILEDVRWADWDSAGQLAVVHQVQGRSRLEYPIGKVLYETSGWISHMRISPTADAIAFMDHPALTDDRGSVCIVDLNGTKTELSGGWESEDGLAWHPDGNEVWFTAAERGYNRVLMAVTRSGKLRTILSVPGTLTLQDVSRDTRVLVSFESTRLVMEGLAAGETQPRDLSWFDWSVARDITADGRWVLFEEASEPAGPHYAVAIRKLDGTAPIRLSDGSGGGLSHDGKWAIAVFTGTPHRTTLVPIGPGQPREIDTAGLAVQNGRARFMPDSQHILFQAAEGGRGGRGWLQSIDGGKPRAITPEGSEAHLASPDGKTVAGTDEERRVILYPVEGGQPRLVPGVPHGYVPVQWTADGKGLYVTHAGRPANVYLVNVTSGEKKLVKTLAPNDPAGVDFISPVVMTPDASAYVYSYRRTLSTLYVVSGLK